MGDIESMPFIEAFRQFQFRVGEGPGSDSFLSLHVSLVPETTDHEQKTKPTQHSIRELRGLGISPDIIICRSKMPLNEKVKEKLAMFCHVTEKRVISVHDCSSIYRVPLLLEKQVRASAILLSSVSPTQTCMHAHVRTLCVSLPRPRLLARCHWCSFSCAELIVARRHPER